MCEFCEKSETTLEKLDSDEDYPCEWFTEEAGPGACSERSVYAVSAWFVDDHLCEAHKRETEKLMDEGLGDFMDSVGFSSDFEIKPIKSQETCDYVAPDATDWKPCGKKAAFAKYILDTSLLCTAHAEESRET
jgi:hypothetical protein